MIGRASFSLALVLLAAHAALAEDSVELVDGRVLEGKIVREEKEWIGLKSGEDVVWIRRAEIVSLARDRPTPNPEPAPTPTPSEDPQPAEKPAPNERPPAPTTDGAGTKGEVVARETPPRPDAPPAPTRRPSPKEEAERHRAEADRIQQALRSDDPERRIAAADWILQTWPKWRDAVEIALGEEEELPRLEAVRLLDHDEVTDPLPLLEIALADTSARVRVAALRVARHRTLTDLESTAIGLMRTDAAWAVRQEAIRTLEDIGGRACLPHVMAAWSSEDDKDRRRRYRRVMAALLGDDYGDDTVAWYRAADEIFMGTREIRKGRVKPADR